MKLQNTSPPPHAAIWCGRTYEDALEYARSLCGVTGECPDIITVTHYKPRTVSVEDIRTQLVDDICIKPYSAPYKVYIVPDADMMSESAQNAILKTLEEPPSYAVIILLADSELAFLPTVRSRVIIERDEQAQPALSLSPVPPAGPVWDSVRNLTEYKARFGDVLDLYAAWYRDVLMFKATKAPDSLRFREELQTIAKVADRTSYEGLEAVLSAIETCRKRLAANVSFDLAVELMLLTFQENG